MPAEPDESRGPKEPEPLDPKVASRAIKKHIQARRETDRRARPAAGPEEEEKAGEAEQQDTRAGENEERLKALRIGTADLAGLMEHSPASLLEGWLRIQTGEEPETAIQVTKTEVEFLLLKRRLMD